MLSNTSAHHKLIINWLLIQDSRPLGNQDSICSVSVPKIIHVPWMIRWSLVSRVIFCSQTSVITNCLGKLFWYTWVKILFPSLERNNAISTEFPHPLAGINLVVGRYNQQWDMGYIIIVKLQSYMLREMKMAKFRCFCVCVCWCKWNSEMEKCEILYHYSLLTIYSTTILLLYLLMNHLFAFTSEVSTRKSLDFKLQANRRKI